jgi:glucose/arabinose dehydrogenase
MCHGLSSPGCNTGAVRLTTVSFVVGACGLVAACAATDAGVTFERADPVTATSPSPEPVATTTLLATTTTASATSDQTTSAPAPTTSPSSPPPTEPPAATTLPPDPLPTVAQLEQAAVALQTVTELRIPVAITWRPGDPNPFVIGQAGPVWQLDSSGTATLVLDLTGRVTPFADGSERGLLGIAFGPDGRIFLNFTDRSSNTTIVSMAMNGNVPDPATEWPILAIDQPGVGHNGGTLAFDAAGNLFVAMGDGGGSNGRDAQDPTKLLGTIMRIRPRLDGPGYDIPPDNPFVGHPEIRPEKYVYGFRNPWKFSIDEATGDIWLGDVGNESWEEIDRVPSGQAGGNYGWYWFEGTHERVDGAPDDLIGPVWEYSHDEGVAVIGGVVYRGTAIPSLRGAYLFGDVTGTIWALGADGVHRLPVDLEGLAGFGEDPNGELWMVSIYGRVVRLVAP